MANFELDPHRFLPRGHGIIDGGPNRLPQTYVTPSSFVPDQFESFCVAVVELKLPAEDLPDLLHLARNYIVQLGFEVINSQSWFYGVGLYQLRSPVSLSALVDHPPRDFGPHHFIKFENHNEGPGYRVHQGACNGWLMIIGVPMDFRNDSCIREAVNTFGDFHYWYSHDMQRCRILVYVTYSSAELVPRDVVFRQPLGEVHGEQLNGGPEQDLQEDAVSVVTAASINPIQANTVMMNEPVMPDLHVPPVHVMQAADAFVQDLQQQFVEVGQEEIPVAVAENTQIHLVPEGQQMQENVDVLMEFPLVDNMFVDQPDINSERAIVVYSPPILQQFEQISRALCAIQSKAAEPASRELAHMHGKRSWSEAFERTVSFSIIAQMDESGQDAAKVFHSVSLNATKGKEEMMMHVNGDEEKLDGDSYVAFVAAPVAIIKKKKPKSKKAETPLVDTSVRRRTRGVAAKEGYRVPPITDIAPKPRKRSRKAALVAHAGQQGEASSSKGATTEPSSAPRIPVATLQKIGDMLGIDQSLLTVDNLTAMPKHDDASKSG
ncbi:hypothetical protein ACQ4PT_056795 [Festuca glaucescens]